MKSQMFLILILLSLLMGCTGCSTSFVPHSAATDSGNPAIPAVPATSAIPTTPTPPPIPTPPPRKLSARRSSPCAATPSGQTKTASELFWLRGMVKKYRDRTLIFLSHHNVLYGFGEEDSSSHLIQSPELPALLRDSGVRLAMTGHMHFPYITQQDGLWEILSGMPFSAPHLIGNLAVGADRILYYAEPVDFGSGNGSGLDGASANVSVKQELDRLDRESAIESGGQSP